MHCSTTEQQSYSGLLERLATFFPSLQQVVHPTSSVQGSSVVAVQNSQQSQKHHSSQSASLESVWAVLEPELQQLSTAARENSDQEARLDALDAQMEKLLDIIGIIRAACAAVRGFFDAMIAQRKGYLYTHTVT